MATIPKKISECAFGNDADFCITNATIRAITNALHLNETGDIHINDAIKQATNCSTESCILSDSRIIAAIGAAKLRIEKDMMLQPFGPKNNKWFSNLEIERLFTQWEKAFPGFYGAPFAMIDFMDTGHALVTDRTPESLYVAGYQTFGCVINTDTSAGPGKHWMALFGDMRSDSAWTIEFFNSSGRQYSQINKYMSFVSLSMERAARAASIMPDIQVAIVCDLVHQRSQSECGPYSLYYIWSRLLGVPYTVFNDSIIPDARMVAFRNFIFRDRE